MMEKLKPCPFCESNDVKVQSRIDILCRSAVRCSNCKAFGPFRYSKEDAAGAWNMRMYPPVLNTAEWRKISSRLLKSIAEKKMLLSDEEYE